MLYELLSGEKPFRGDSLGALMFTIANGTYTPLREIAPDVPACCLPIVEKLLTKAQTRRYAKAGQVLKHLQDCLQETG